ncbi:hypothetical protein HPB47_011005, partial [Ixodes persulcatus]
QSFSRQLNIANALSSGQIGSAPELCRALGRQVPEVKKMITESPFPEVQWETAVLGPPAGRHEAYGWA